MIGALLLTLVLIFAVPVAITLFGADSPAATAVGVLVEAVR
jgi:hypothetical protein